MDELNPLELKVMNLLAEGLDASSICNWINIDYQQYLKSKKSILKKLKIKRITEILPAAIKSGLIKFR